jgi:hypothetical protein
MSDKPTVDLNKVDKVPRTLSGILAGTTSAGGCGLVLSGLLAGALTVLGFFCAGDLDSNSGPFGGGFGLMSLLWMIIAVFLGPAALALLVSGAWVLLVSSGFGWFALRR